MATENVDLAAKAEQYETDGYAIVPEVVDETLVEEGRRHVEWLQEQNPDRRPEQLGHDLMAGDPFWVRLVSDPRILDVVEEFVGPDVGLFASHYIAKPPENGQPVLWHQDGAYWGLEPMDVVTVWLSFDVVRRDNGGMKVIPGTQEMDLKEMRERTDEENVLESETTADVDESDAVDLELDPGDVSVHHPNIIHGSDGNGSDRWRRGLTIRYIPTSTTITQEPQPWPASFFLRGDETTGENRYMPWPTYDPDGENMAFEGWETYNERAREMNERVAATGRLVEE
jgi:ectoine hydroxylase-related dioxygenase (phytanoyl-CoA dioxygenase family)